LKGEKEMKPVILKRNVLQRILGIPASKPPIDQDCWTFSGGSIEIDLSRVPELSEPGRAIRLEKKNLQDRVLIIHGEDGHFHAFRNRCKHMGRRLDPVPGTQTVQCCSVNKTTYDYGGEVLFGPAKAPLDVRPVEIQDGRLIVKL
jgi:nitrite reductase/ring-hydroxylating ferredoxin subunit